ncbi:hypothetical protein BJ508DRAFT_378418 [Ascobolus immersus RN42]|uniref:C2H2-type domain-containing protein n=1 Tax=Ascobolus immersus RN42 TaxID=1160509 RepID=A0A3N4HYL1_ASCIM|nr:hypothetical protein BJ508DRAFT_378418 [Ascobolus immersus RN42]
MKTKEASPPFFLSILQLSPIWAIERPTKTIQSNGSPVYYSICNLETTTQQHSPRNPTSSPASLEKERNHGRWALDVSPGLYWPSPSDDFHSTYGADSSANLLQNHTRLGQNLNDYCGRVNLAANSWRNMHHTQSDGGTMGHGRYGPGEASATLGLSSHPQQMRAETGFAAPLRNLQQAENDIINDLYQQDTELPFSLEQTQLSELDNEALAVDATEMLFDFEDYIEGPPIPDLTLVPPTQFTAESQQTSVQASANSPQDQSTDLWHGFGSTYNSFNFVNQDPASILEIFSNPDAQTFADCVLASGSDSVSDVQHGCLPSNSDAVDATASSSDSQLKDPALHYSDPPVHRITQFCEPVSDPPDINKLYWYEKKLHDGSILPTRIPCFAIQNTLDVNSAPCRGSCLCSVELGCRVNGCPFQNAQFASDEIMKKHIEKHLQPPISASQLNSENLQALLAYLGPPSPRRIPNRSLREMSISSGDDTAYSESSLGRSPGSRWNEIQIFFRHSTRSSIAGGGVSPTLSQRTMSEQSFTTANSTDLYCTSNTSQDERRPGPIRTGRRRASRAEPVKKASAHKSGERHLCPYETCERSEKGKGFNRSDNLLNHRRDVHGEDIPKLPKGRKKKVVESMDD